eukprot:COSAG06_NODE_175_length_21137_cov_71.560790_1_plen_364_part_00
MEDTAAEETAAADQLYAAVAAAMDADPAIDELAVVPSDQLAALGARAAGFAVVEHKLAISRASLRRLWAAGLRELRALLRGGLGADGPRRMHHATRAVLMANTDHYTAWNARKRHLVLPGSLTPQDELRLVDLLLAKHPKSGEAWSHRRWVLSRVRASAAEGSGDGDLAAAATHEMAVCAAAARSYPKNYYAWTHRYWALSRLAPELAASECDAMRQWAAVNTSDHAGLHYRGSAVLLAVAPPVQCPPRPPDSVGRASSQPGRAAWQQAWEQGSELQARYPGHESMWRHRRVLAWIAHSHAHALGSASVDGAAELQYAASREELARAEVAKDSLGEREQRQWHSEALCASQYSRWARVALNPD